VPDLLLEKINLEEATQLNGDRLPEPKVAEHVSQQARGIVDWTLMRETRIKRKRRIRSSERSDRWDYNFAVATIALSSFSWSQVPVRGYLVIQVRPL
jgi:hypothetical protein